MRNDDWEEGLMMKTPAATPPYQHARKMVQYSQQQAPQLREVTHVEATREVARGRAARPVETRPPLPPRTTVPAQRAPLSPAHIQAAGHSAQRTTQPLNTRV